jgi:hypothetical protein
MKNRGTRAYTRLLDLPDAAKSRLFNGYFSGIAMNVPFSVMVLNGVANSEALYSIQQSLRGGGITFFRPDDWGFDEEKTENNIDVKDVFEGNYPKKWEKECELLNEYIQTYMVDVYRRD